MLCLVEDSVKCGKARLCDSRALEIWKENLKERSEGNQAQRQAALEDVKAAGSCFDLKLSQIFNLNKLATFY